MSKPDIDLRKLFPVQVKTQCTTAMTAIVLLSVATSSLASKQLILYVC